MGHRGVHSWYTRCFVPDDKLSGEERDAGFFFVWKMFTISQIKDHIWAMLN